MANISLSIPDDQLTRVVDALCWAGGWSSDLGVTRNAFAKQEAARLLRERVVAIERQQIRQAAAAQELATVEPGIT